MKTIDIRGCGEEINFGQISEKKAKEIIANGVTEDELSEILTDSECGMTEIYSISVNGNKLKLSIPSITKSAKYEELDIGTKKKSYLLQVQEIEGLFHSFELDGDYDAKKMSIYSWKYLLGSTNYSFSNFTASYNGQDNIPNFDFSDRGYIDASYYVVLSNGEVHEISIIGEEEETDVDFDSDESFFEEDENDENDSQEQNNTRAKRLYTFKNRMPFDNFKKYIDSEIRPRIEEGLENISIIIIEEKSKNLFEITFIGSQLDISSLPDTHKEWVQKEIGSFTFEDTIIS